MELRTTEQKIDNLIIVYSSLRNVSLSFSFLSNVSSEYLLEIPPRPIVGENQQNDVSVSAVKEDEQDPKSSDSTTPNSSLLDSLAHFVSTFGELQSGIISLQPMVDRFRKRLQETDPVTGNPRYGERTQARVQNLCTAYDTLKRALLPEATPTAKEISDSEVQEETNQELLPWMLYEQMRRKLDQERNLSEQERQDQEAKRKQEEERRAKEFEQLQRQKEQERKRQEELQAQREAESAAELRRRADEARRQRQAEQDAERAWIESIEVGRDGVENAIRQLKISTADDLNAQRVALASLHRLFQQINAHPEEPNFRRVRRDHAQFHQDIGRHKGGQEVLLAAGFELGAIDDTPCFLSKEPDIENDMDGWSAWFDLLKATLEILEKEQV